MMFNKQRSDVITQKMIFKPKHLFVEHIITRPELLKKIIFEFQMRPVITNILRRIGVAESFPVFSIDRLMDLLYQNIDNEIVVQGLEKILISKKDYIERL